VQIELFSEPGYSVRSITPQETYWWLLNIHYAKRVPPISHSFGLFRDGELVGVITYGKPASPSLCKGIAGEKYSSTVLELNRLVLRDNKKNEASQLIAGSLKLLPTPTIVASYADTDQDHLGVVYQATNWIYSGITVARTEWAVEGLEHMHTKALTNQFESLEAIKEHYGDRFYYRDRSQKHRYLMFLGNRTEKKAMLAALKYPILDYPKREHANV